MAKRFIDSNLFKKNFLRGLEAPLKLLWIYLFCDCSAAGIWEVDFEISSIYTGSKIDPEKVKQVFKNRLVFFDGGTKIFIPDFIEFQYGNLNENNPAHKNIIKDLAKYGFYDLDNKVLKPLGSTFGLPTVGSKVKEMVMVKDDILILNNNVNIKTEGEAPEINLFNKRVEGLMEFSKQYFHEKYLNAAAADTFEKLGRIDRYTNEEIKNAIAWARADDFWSANFLSPCKLRSKDKNGVKYIDIFLAKIVKNGANKQSAGNGASWDEITSVIRGQYVPVT